MRKVYCYNCCNRVRGDFITRCYIGLYESTPLECRKIYHNCCSKNIDNKCKDFIPTFWYQIKKKLGIVDRCF